MSEVTIPRPVAVLWKEERPYQEPLTRLELWPPFEPLEIFAPLITTTQAEAYKDACVREALELAAKVCDARALKNEQAISEADDPEDATSLRSAAWQMSVCARKIRNLLSTPA